MFGTVLLLGGLSAAAICVWFLTQGYILEGGCLAFIGAVMLGTGTHLMKVALAVRVLLRERDPAK
jgi:hypothetical protein